MKNQELYDIFTAKTTDIPPEDIYYQRLGRILHEMRIQQGVTPQQIHNDIGITPDELRRYEDGVSEITIYNLLLLLSYIEHNTDK